MPLTAESSPEVPTGPTDTCLQITAQTPTSRETCPVLLSLLSSSMEGPLLFCTQKLSSPRLAYSHLLTTPLSPSPGIAQCPARWTARSGNQCWLRGRGLSRGKQYLVPTHRTSTRDKHVLQDNTYSFIPSVSTSHVMNAEIK